MRKLTLLFVTVVLVVLSSMIAAQGPATDCPEAAAVLPVIAKIATDLAGEPDIAIELIYTAVQEVRVKCRPAPFYEPRHEGPPPLDAAFFAPLPMERLEDGGFVLGNPQARVTIVLFADWYCPACQQYKPTIDQLLRDYVAKGRARFELRTLPTAGVNASPNTTQVADLLECVNAQKPGSYFYASELAFELILSGNAGADFSQGLAERSGVNFPELLRCTQSASQDAADLRLARDLNVSSTPTVLYRVDGGRPQRLPDRSMQGIAAIIDSLQP
ncbi:MAG: thioredoxin domain-containing protein [Chloroflexi bacterium]|nr:thioredoxin domain-containing protein [Chloroflexota bacterium]